MKIICVGRNYAEHAAEMNAETPAAPVLFLKPDTAILRNNQDFFYPEFSKDVHYECEIIYRVSKEGKYIKPKFALNHLDGIGLGIDFTARDVQKELKAKGLPWEISKGFNGSAAISEFLPLSHFASLNQLTFELRKNGEVVQRGFSGDMIFAIEQVVEYASQFFTFKTGDLIFTGTPVGVGPVQVGDRLEGFLMGQKMFSFSIR